MKVVIFCGGKGTRLREETEYTPKPMIRIGGRPILWHIMKIYSHYGLNDFILCVGYKQEVIRDYFLNYRHMGNDFTIDLGEHGHVQVHSCNHEDWRVTVVDTGLDTKKGQRLKNAARYLDGERFMLTYGDGVADIDMDRLLQHHNSTGALVTFTGVHPISRFAMVETDEAGGIRDWTEKARLDEYINGGFFVVEPGALDYIDGDVEFEEEPMKRLAREGRVSMFRHEGFWHCMDTYRDYLVLEELWRQGNSPWKVWPDAGGNGQ